MVRCAVLSQCGDDDCRPLHSQSAAHPGPRPISVPAKLIQCSTDSDYDKTKILIINCCDTEEKDFIEQFEILLIQEFY